MSLTTDETTEAPEPKVATDQPVDHRFERRPLTLRTLAVVGVLSHLAVGWLLAGLFHGAGSAVTILALAVAGVVVACVAGRLASTPARLLAPMLPLALVLAAAARNATEGLGVALADALGSGQLGQPPVGFGPAWQLLIGVLLISLGAASVNLALWRDSARVAALLPVPVVAGLSLIQPPGRELLAILPAVALVLLALARAHAAELAPRRRLGGRSRAAAVGPTAAVGGRRRCGGPAGHHHRRRTHQSRGDGAAAAGPRCRRRPRRGAGLHAPRAPAGAVAAGRARPVRRKAVAHAA